MDSDPDLEIIDKDSGMSSMGGSKDETPERRALELSEANGNGESYDDEPDETMSERLWGLTEMFPEPIRNACDKVSTFSVLSAKTVFKFSCNASWIFFTSSMILLAPVVFETERANMEQMQKSQQKQVLLGPGSAAMAQGGPGGIPALPPMSR